MIHPDRLGDFLEIHRDDDFVAHNVAFDFWVIDQHLRLRGHPAVDVLLNAADRGWLHDSMILDMLIQTASGNYRHKGSNGDKLIPSNLGVLAEEYLAETVNKDDPYRTRFGELIGLSEEQLLEADQGFFEYATADADVLHRLYQRLVTIAYELMVDYGYNIDPERNRSDILTEAPGHYGLLTETIQIRTSIVFADMFRKGVGSDQQKAEKLLEEFQTRLDDVTESLDEQAPNLFKRDRNGNFQLTPSGSRPSMNENELKRLLQKAAFESNILAPQSRGKGGGTSISTEVWEPFRGKHTFIDKWIKIREIGKAVEFLRKIASGETLHCRYNVLTRTGRTTCAAPKDKQIPGLNLQQIPHEEIFRELFLPREPGDRLLIADYSAVELRTLAAICESRFSQSKLAEVIRDGIDPHAFTAAMIRGMSLEDFLRLKESSPDDYRNWRQAAKAVNFGVPGGLGASSLRDYAASQFGAVMTVTEARQFRQKLIEQIYPELNDRNGYLADSSVSNLARNLMVSEDIFLHQLDMRGANRRFTRGIPNLIRGTSTAQSFYQTRVWQRLQRIVHMRPHLPAEVRDAILQRRGSEELYHHLYFTQVASPTGRIRGGVSYTSEKNTPFQALAADGAKLALWRLFRAGFDIWGFVHDEFVINLPAGSTDADAERAVKIVEESMSEVLVTIPAECEWTIADHWGKP